MFEFNNIRLALNLSWNEFYLCYLVQEKSDGGYCALSRNEIADNCGVSKQAVIDLVKKLDQSGYITNESGKLKCSLKWSRNFTEALEFSNSGGKETLPDANLYGKETLPLSNSSDKETLPPTEEPVKILYQYPKDSGKESLPVETEEVKNLYQQQQENTVLNQENDQNGKETLPVEAKSDIYIYTKDNISINGNIIKEKGCGEKQNSKPVEKEKPYDLEIDETTGTATCKVLRQACSVFYKEKPELYPAEMYKKFISYWSAPNKKGVPLWYQKLSAKNGTFHLPGRLATWNSNNFNSSSNNQNGIRTNKGGSGALRPTSIAEPSKRTGQGNVANVEF